MSVEERIAIVAPRLLVGLSCREPEHTRELRRAGVRHWADHRRTQCPEDLRSLLPGVHYLWNPIRDDGEPKPIEWYSRTVSFARAALHEPDGAVLLTCARGMHRGPSMAYAVMRAALDVSSEEALAQIAAAWPAGDPYYADDIEAKLAVILADRSAPKALQ